MTRPLEELFDELSGPRRPLGSTDWPEPATLRRRAEHQRTVRRASIASSVAVVAAVAIAVPVTLAGHHATTISPASRNTAPPVTTHKAAPAPDTSTPGTPLAAGAPTPTGERRSFGTISIVIPTGWDARTTVDPHITAPYDRHVCLQPPSPRTARSLYGCAGLDIYYGTSLPGEGTAAFEGNRTNTASWHHDTAAAVCPQTPAQLDAGTTLAAGPLTGPDQSVYAFPTTGNATASYQMWHVSCADGSTFNPQSWYFPRSHAVFFLYDENLQAQAVLSTILTTRNAAKPST